MAYLLVSSSKESPTERLREVMNEALNKVDAEFQQVKDASAATYPPIQPVEWCNGFGKRQASISDYEDRHYGGTSSSYSYSYQSKRSVDEVETYCKGLAEEMKAAAEAIHTKNLPAIESNTKLKAALTSLMTAIKMPAKYTTSDYGASGRARRKRSYETAAGWVSDIQREIKTEDGYQQMLNDYQRFLTDIQSYVAQRRQKDADEKRKKDEEAAQIEKVRLLGVYQGRYGLPVTATPHDVLDHLLTKDKYLRLAHYLYLNRCSWVEGPSYASAGLGGFEVVTETDKAIYDEIEPCISDWDGDGRVFRDGAWGYDAIYALAPEPLLKEYREVLEWVGTDNLV